MYLQIVVTVCFANFYRASAQQYWHLILILSVRPFVRPSVRHAAALYQNDSTYNRTFSAHASPIIPAFPTLNNFARFRRGHHLLWCWLYKFRDFKQCLAPCWERYKIGLWLLWNDNTKIKIMRSIERWHLRWLWVTFECHFSNHNHNHKHICKAP